MRVMKRKRFAKNTYMCIYIYIHAAKHGEEKEDEHTEGRPTLLRSSCLMMVYKNLDISGLLGMVGPRIRFASLTIGSIRREKAGGEVLGRAVQEMRARSRFSRPCARC
jgi:hypothetical protein